MPSKRIPISRDGRRKVTPTAIAAFERMQRARTDDAWWAAHSGLCDEMAAMPWEWPIIEDPHAENPYSCGSYAAQQWETRRAERPERFELFRQLQEAAAAARAARKQNGAAAPAEAQAVPEGHRRRVRSRRSAAWAAPGR
jgi:hypothetical protein